MLHLLLSLPETTLCKTATATHCYPSFRLPPIKVQVPTPNEQEDQIATHERTKYTKVTPPVIEGDAQRLVELIADAICAVGTIRRRVVGNVAWTTSSEEGLHVVAAGRARWGSEAIEFGLSTDDGLAMKFVRDECGDEAGESVRSLSVFIIQ